MSDHRALRRRRASPTSPSHSHDASTGCVRQPQPTGRRFGLALDPDHDDVSADRRHKGVLYFTQYGFSAFEGGECNGADAQLWRLDAQRRLVSKNGKCLDAWGTNYDAKKNGIPLTVWDCHDGKNQKWRFDGPYFTADNGMNLDLNLENGILHLWEAFTTPNQHWVFGD